MHYVTTNQAMSAEAGAAGAPRVVARPRSSSGFGVGGRIPFIGISTHQAEFPGYDADAGGRVKRPQSAADGAMGRGKGLGSFVTTNQALMGPLELGLRDHQVFRRPELARQASALSDGPHGGAFWGDSTYRKAYVPKKGLTERLRRGMLEGGNFPHLLCDDRDFTTTNRKEFLAPPSMPPCPAIPYLDRPVSADGHITTREENELPAYFAEHPKVVSG